MSFHAHTATTSRIAVRRTDRVCLGFVCSLAMSRDHERTLVAIEAGVSEVTCKFVSGILPACCLVEGVEWCAGLLILCESTIRLTHQGLLFTRISGRPCSEMVFLFFLHAVARRGTRRARHAYMQRRTLWGTRTRARGRTHGLDVARGKAAQVSPRTKKSRVRPRGACAAARR